MIWLKHKKNGTHMNRHVKMTCNSIIYAWWSLENRQRKVKIVMARLLYQQIYPSPQGLMHPIFYISYSLTRFSMRSIDRIYIEFLAPPVVQPLAALSKFRSYIMSGGRQTFDLYVTSGFMVSRNPLIVTMIMIFLLFFSR